MTTRVHFTDNGQSLTSVDLRHDVGFEFAHIAALAGGDKNEAYNMLNGSVRLAHISAGAPFQYMRWQWIHKLITTPYIIEKIEELA